MRRIDFKQLARAAYAKGKKVCPAGYFKVKRGFWLVEGHGFPKPGADLPVFVSSILGNETAQLFESVSLSHAYSDCQHYQQAQYGSYGYFADASNSYLA